MFMNGEYFITFNNDESFITFMNSESFITFMNAESFINVPKWNTISESLFDGKVINL